MASSDVFTCIKRQKSMVWHQMCQLSILIWNEMVGKLDKDFLSVSENLFPVDKIESWFNYGNEFVF